MKYRRVLVKLSGEALAGNGQHGIIDPNSLSNTVKVIASIARKGVQVSLVVGAGNICRGALATNEGFDRIEADHMGMLGTIINAIALKNAFKNEGLEAVVLSAVEVNQFVETYDARLASEYLDKNVVVIFGGGIGKPYYSTDTCAITRAIETDSQAVLMAKNGVDGVYSDDPRVNKSAHLYKTITVDEIISQNLKVMDLSAAKLLTNHDIDVRVFNMNDPNNIVRIIEGEDIGTTIKRG